MKKIVIILLALLQLQVYGEKPILLIGATAHIGNGEVYENSIISVNNGVFEIVGDATKIRIDPSAFDTIYRLNGKHIYPAFIVPQLWVLLEIGAVRATHDYREVGGYNPNVRTLIAYNTDSKILNTVISNGVMIAQVTPKGNVISGQSSVMYLKGDNWEDAQLREMMGYILIGLHRFILRDGGLNQVKLRKMIIILKKLKKWIGFSKKLQLIISLQILWI